MPLQNLALLAVEQIPSMGSGGIITTLEKSQHDITTRGITIADTVYVFGFRDEEAGYISVAEEDKVAAK